MALRDETSSSPAPGPPGEWRPRHNPWLIAVSVMLATFMEILDTSVANVALPHIAGNLSATTDESTWVLTSYLISNAVILPASGWLASFFGRKRLLMACIVVFTIASAFAGAASSLGLLVLARVVQGAGGGALQPISQAVLLESFPPARRGVAMAAFGLGVVVAPTIGPSLGGWITDEYSWRWIFFINLPIGAVALLLAQMFIEDPPYIRAAGAAARSRIDFLGFGLMTVWLGTLQIILDKGQEADWFEAVWIRWTAALSGVCMIAFIARQLLTRSPIVDLRVLRDRNFASGVGFIFIVGAVLYSMITLLPLFLQTLMGYSAIESGYAMTPRGFGAIVGTFLVGRFGRSLDSRYLIALGFGLLVYSGILFSDITLEVGFWSFAWPNIINGFGVSLLFVPLTTMAMGTLRNEVMGNATGIYNLMRNLGGSVGISLVTTMIARSSQVHRAYLVSHLTPYDAAFTRRVEALQAALTPRLGSYQAGRVALAAIEGTLNTQSALASYVDILRWIALACAFCIPAVFIFRRVRRAAPASAH